MGWFNVFKSHQVTNLSQEEVTACKPLAEAINGSRVSIIEFDGKNGINRLLSLGLTPGSELQIISNQVGGPVLVAIEDQRLGLGAEISERIMVRETASKIIQKKEQNVESQISTYLRDMLPGTIGRVVGYDKTMRGYKGKLLSMGLTPGTEFKVIRVAPLGDPIEISVRDFYLSLRKQEADTLCVEEVTDD